MKVTNKTNEQMAAGLQEALKETKPKRRVMKKVSVKIPVIEHGDPNKQYDAEGRLKKSKKKATKPKSDLLNVELLKGLLVLTKQHGVKKVSQHLIALVELSKTR